MESEQWRHLDEKSEERKILVEKIYQAALAEHPRFKEFSESEIRGVIENAVIEIEELEKFADPKMVKEALTPEIAKNLKALWVFSGPGTYDDAKKDDRYKNYTWAEWMDHDRLSYAGWLARVSAELIAEGKNSHGSITEASERKTGARKMISEVGPVIIYNGTAQENEVVRDIPTREGIIVPREKVMVAKTNIANTVDQVKTFQLPESVHQSGAEIGLVSHAPHLMRVMHMLKRYQSVPEDMKLRLFPVASPAEGKEEYTTLEIKGLLYYIYLSKNQDAESEPYPYTIHGKE